MRVCSFRFRPFFGASARQVRVALGDEEALAEMLASLGAFSVSDGWFSFRQAASALKENALGRGGGESISREGARGVIFSRLALDEALTSQETGKGHIFSSALLRLPGGGGLSVSLTNEHEEEAATIPSSKPTSGLSICGQKRKKN